MAKLNKANTKGSVSIIIPKNLLKKLGWLCGDDVSIYLNQTQDKVIISKPVTEDI